MAVELNQCLDESLDAARRGFNLVAASYMLFAVSVFSLVPLAINLSGGPQAPFLFNAWFRLGTAVGCTSFLVAFHWHTLLEKQIVLLIGMRVFEGPSNKLIVGTIISTFDFALLAWSARYVDIAVSTILFEAWPVFMILFTHRLFREEGRYRNISPMMMGLTVLSLTGFLFAISSQVSDINSLAGFLHTLWSFWEGVLLAVAAIICTMFFTSAWKWGVIVNEEVAQGPGDESLDLCFVVVAYLIASLVSLLAAVGLASFEGVGMSFRGMVIASAAGIFLAIGNISWGKANLATDNLGINAMAYAVPVLSIMALSIIPRFLVWIGMVDVPQAGVSRWDLLVIGAAAIIASNLLINFEVEVRWGFETFLLALRTCGATAYLRDGVFAFRRVFRRRPPG